MVEMLCRIGCGACCTAPSISSPIPGMPLGKAAGARCVQLTRGNRCRIFDKPERPRICVSYRATAEFCGADRHEALNLLSALELMTTNA